MFDIYKLFVDGQKKLLAAGAEAEKAKVGILRAGNSGMLTAEGEIVGPCMAATYLRFRGVDVKGLEDDGDSGGAAGRELMFEGGRTNEDSWMNVLKQSWTGKILREEETPTSWVTASGVKVTGRPDIVLCDETGKPVRGIELKQVSSFWTAYEVKFKGMPKYPHLLQAGHYSWQLGVPFEIWYTSRTDYHIASFISNQLPKPGEEGSDYLAYTYSRLKPAGGKSKISKAEYELLPPKTREAAPLKVTPFIHGYLVEFRAGVLHYREAPREDVVVSTKWVKTGVTVENIRRYYEVIPGLKEVPPEPTVLKADGGKANYKASDYCSLGFLCCKYREGAEINKWVEDVKQELTNKAQVNLESSDKSR